MNRRALLAGMCSLAVPCVGSVPRKSLATENAHFRVCVETLQGGMIYGSEVRMAYDVGGNVHVLHGGELAATVPLLYIRRITQLPRFSPSVVKLEGCGKER